jgi:hypothetical protein
LPGHPYFLEEKQELATSVNVIRIKAINGNFFISGVCFSYCITLSKTLYFAKLITPGYFFDFPSISFC